MGGGEEGQGRKKKKKDRGKKERVEGWGIGGGAQSNAERRREKMKIKSNPKISLPPSSALGMGGLCVLGGGHYLTGRAPPFRSSLPPPLS